MTKNNINRPIVAVLVGLPASGKSFARSESSLFENILDSYHYSTDDAIDALCAEVGITYSEGFMDFIKEAQTIANIEVDQAIADGRSVIWDQTNLSTKKRRKILMRFGNGYRKECFCFLPPFTGEQSLVLKARLDDRPGKDIPAFVMRNMLESFQLPTTNEAFNRVRYFDIHGTVVKRLEAAELFPNRLISII
jgi:predicted kinase